MMEIFIKTINDADENIKLAYQKKEKVIDDFLEENKPICECFHSIWKNDEKLFKKDLEEIANKYNYKFMYGYGNRYNNDNFRFDNILEEFITKFPIYNIDGQNIFDELPGSNYDWYFEDQSTENEIKIEVTPSDIYARYPTDPENNNMIFTFILNKDIFNKLECEKDELKIKEILMPYYNQNRKDYLKVIEDKVKEKADIINKKLKDIDFSDPEIINEIKNRMK